MSQAQAPDEEAQPAPEPEPLTVHGLPATEVRGTTVIHTDVARYEGLVQALHAEGYSFAQVARCADAH